MTRDLVAFVSAAFFEIAGCFAFWSWLRRGVSPWVTCLGVLSLVVFAVILTRADSPFAGRAYAAYGGIYIAASRLAVGGGRSTADDGGRDRSGDCCRGSHGHHRVRQTAVLMWCRRQTYSTSDS